MRKYIPSGILLLLYLPVIAQEEGRVRMNEFKPAGHTIYLTKKTGQFSIQSPANATVQEQMEGRLLYKATIKRSALHGAWQSWYPNGYTCDSGRLARNIPDGEWKYWNAEGNLMALRHFNAEGYHRVMEEITRPHPRRNFYQLGLIAIQNQEQALSYLQAEKFYTGKGSAVKFHSVRDLVLANSKGEMYRPVFETGLLDGLYMNFFENGQVRDSGDYKSGLREGIWMHRASTLSDTETGLYQNGLKEQEWKLYTAEGRLKQILFYRKGILQWQKQFAH